MAKQPKIRFKGFTEEWEEGKIGDAFCERDEHSGNGELLSVTINSGIRRAKDMERTFATGDLSKYKVVQKGDIAYNTMRMWQGACGVSEYSGIVSPAYTIATPKDEQDSAFYAYYFKSNKMLHDFRINSQGLTSDTWNLRYPVFASIGIHYPSKKEQQEISLFLRSLDTAISQRETELEKLKNIKRALLEKLFPQDGQSIPALRFKGFEGKWSDVPFGKLIIENKEVSTIENEDTLLSSAIEGMFLNSELFDHQRGQSNIGYRKITKGMLILSAQNLHLGNANVNLRFDHGIVSPAYKTYNIQGADTEFMAVWVKREETKAFFDKATTAGASKCRKNIDWDDLYQQNLAMPLDDEQKKIGKFILTLDRLITLREKYIKQLKHSKQALLEQMFVNS